LMDEHVDDWHHSTFHKLAKKGIYPENWVSCDIKDVQAGDEGDYFMRRMAQAYPSYGSAYLIKLHYLGNAQPVKL